MNRYCLDCNEFGPDPDCPLCADLVCGFCGHEPEDHGDSDAGPMSVCPAPTTSESGGVYEHACPLMVVLGVPS